MFFLSGCSSSRVIDPFNQKVFKALGYEDRNNSEAIERLSWFQLWTADPEGYENDKFRCTPLNSDAKFSCVDINQDGKVDADEAFAFLQSNYGETAYQLADSEINHGNYADIKERYKKLCDGFLQNNYYRRESVAAEALTNLVGLGLAHERLELIEMALQLSAKAKMADLPFCCPSRPNKNKIKLSEEFTKSLAAALVKSANDGGLPIETRHLAIKLLDRIASAEHYRYETWKSDSKRQQIVFDEIDGNLRPIDDPRLGSYLSTDIDKKLLDYGFAIRIHAKIGSVSGVPLVLSMLSSSQNGNARDDSGTALRQQFMLNELALSDPQITAAIVRIIEGNLLWLNKPADDMKSKARWAHMMFVKASEHMRTSDDSADLKGLEQLLLQKKGEAESRNIAIALLQLGRYKALKDFMLSENKGADEAIKGLEALIRCKESLWHPRDFYLTDNCELSRKDIDALEAVIIRIKFDLNDEAIIKGAYKSEANRDSSTQARSKAAGANGPGEHLVGEIAIDTAAQPHDPSMKLRGIAVEFDHTNEPYTYYLPPKPETPFRRYKGTYQNYSLSNARFTFGDAIRAFSFREYGEKRIFIPAKHLAKELKFEVWQGANEASIVDCAPSTGTFSPYN
ncbi:MAG: hypothetical protein WC956_04460 [bacterium]